MSLSGSTADGPIMIREDPARASTGSTDITDVGGGLYHIDSFFDVFTELSVDGGLTWRPCTSSTRMSLEPKFQPAGVDSPSADLPPDGVYVSPEEYHEYAAAGIILDDPAHYPFTEDAVRVPDGDDELETFESRFTAVEIGQGLGPITLTGPVQVRTTNRGLSTAGLFDTEIVSMSLSGSTPTGGTVLIREDPSRASTGSTDITDIGGGLHHIDSFFDVFTELSVDGGSSWIASDTSTRMHLVVPEFEPEGVDSTSADLPPEGVYISPHEYHRYAAAGITLDDPAHYPFTQDVVRERVGNDEIETFESRFTAVEIGQGYGPITLTGPVQVMTTDRALSTAGLFDTEIVSMSLSGSTPTGGVVMIREDPSRASTGSTDIADLGGGLYHIDSFFDVFTELSVDGGNSWIASDSSTRMHLVPESPQRNIPAVSGWGMMVAVLLLAMAGMIVVRRQRSVRA